MAEAEETARLANRCTSRQAPTFRLAILGRRAFVTSGGDRLVATADNRAGDKPERKSPTAAVIERRALAGRRSLTFRNIMIGAAVPRMWTVGFFVSD
jgi:hypothetical protein